MQPHAVPIMAMEAAAAREQAALPARSVWYPAGRGRGTLWRSLGLPETNGRLPNGDTNMTRKEVYAQIEEMFGLVPSFIKAIPDSALEFEWQLMKRVQFDEGPIPNKYRELIGVAIAAAMKCRFCSFYHTEIAKLNGATDAEIEDAVHYAKSSAGWSTYLNGLQFDFEQFKSEIQQACEHVRSAPPVKKSA